MKPAKISPLQLDTKVLVKPLGVYSSIERIVIYGLQDDGTAFVGYELHGIDAEVPWAAENLEILESQTRH